MILSSRYRLLRRTDRDVRRRRLRFESMEEKRLLAVLTVNTDQDSFGPGDGLTSLREAIEMSNDLIGVDKIVLAKSLGTAVAMQSKSTEASQSIPP